MISLLLIGILAWAFNIQLVKAEPKTWTVDYDGPEGFPKIRDIVIGAKPADAFLASMGHWSVPTSESFFENGLDARLMDVFQLPLKAGDKWNFSRAWEWRKFACVDDDSAELVIGVNERNSYSCLRLANLVSLYGGELVDKVSFGGKVQAIVVDVQLKELSHFVSEVKARNLSRYIEPNLKVKADFVPNDPDWSKQWGPQKIEADWAWNTTAGDSSILVAIPDTGIDYTHPDLAANYVALGYDWVNNDTDPIDDMGHGTHCAGIIAAVLNNKIGIAGVAQVRIMAEKMLNVSGWGTETDAAKAIIHAVDQGANIISCSWGGDEDNILAYEAVKYAYDNGVLVVASAGNNPRNPPHYPARYDEVVAVTATNYTDEPARFTSFGQWVEVAAPGVDIYSTMPTYPISMGLNLNYDSMSGTSMACPHVAGVAALIWSQFPNYTQREVRFQLRRTATDLGELGFDVYYGYGRINAKRAVEEAIPDHDLFISDLKTPRAVQPETTGAISATVTNGGLCSEVRVTLKHFINGSLFNTTTIDFLADFVSATVNFTWTPTIEGTYNITSYVVPVANETITENNALSKYIVVRTPKAFRVPDDYPTIQGAVNATVSGWGDKIVVAPGTYYECVYIDRSNLTIFGEDAETTIIDGNYSGVVILVKYASNVNVSSFTLQHGKVGVHLYASSGCTLRDVALTGNRANFAVSRDWDAPILLHFVHDIDTSNTVEGKPIYYWINEQNRTVPLDAGYIAAINSTNIKMKDLKMTNNFHGALFAYTNSSTIENVTISDNADGVNLFHSNGVLIRDNIVKNCSTGILLGCSDGNTITNNRMENTIYAIELSSSNNNTVFKNTATNPSWTSWLVGIILINSNNNTLEENKVTGRGGKWYPEPDSPLEWGIAIGLAKGNTVAKNTLTNLSFIGVGLENCSQNIISNNIIAKMGWFAFSIKCSENNTIHENSVKDSYVGITLDETKNNVVYHNCFVNNTYHVETWGSFNDVWDVGYPSGGNYWSGYKGEDLYSGPYQNQTGSDGIGDTPYVINENNVDRYPLIFPPKILATDLNGDGKVDILDVGIVAKSYGTTPEDPNWNPIVDLDGNKEINILDIAKVARDYGKTAY